MDISAQVTLPCTVDVAFARVRDLTTYPSWLSIVDDVVADGDGAWLVSLGARLGPVARTKRVRMERVIDEAPSRARFERREQDGRTHSPWVLDAEVAPDDADPAGSHLTMHLHYGGSRWVPLLDVVLTQEVRRAGGRLARQLAQDRSDG